jgi:pre-mRNA cleavage complex 2 protein Pcf11
MSYGHYPQAQQQQQQHYQPPHQGYGGGGGYGMPPHHDPFRAWYASKLAELTFNSRPIIQNLSVQAVYKRDEGDWAGMQGITEEIEQAVLRVRVFSFSV